jgi:hypothetical protein
MIESDNAQTIRECIEKLVPTKIPNNYTISSLTDNDYNNRLNENYN